MINNLPQDIYKLQGLPLAQVVECPFHYLSSGVFTC